MAKVARTSKISETTCCTTTNKDSGINRRQLVGIRDVHVLFVTWTKSGIIEATNIRPVQIIQENRIDNLLNRDAFNVFCG